MRAPDFWYPPAGASPSSFAGLLKPAAFLYDRVGRLRRRLARPYRAGVPVICVGNLVAGGTGKTPTACAIGRRLQAQGLTPAFLTRGYGGRERGPLRVDPAFHDAADVGDEALLLAQTAMTVVARDRAAGAQAARLWGADAIVMDDGMQNPSLAKDLTLLVVDSDMGFGNGQVLPAGPLREPIAEGLARTDAVVLYGDAGPPPELILEPRPLPILPARLAPAPAAAAAVAGRRVIAFAGIGRPAKFFRLLKDCGADIVLTRAFPDHHVFGPNELSALRAEARAAGASLVTTEKDFHRLPAADRAGIGLLPVTTHFAEPQRLDALLAPLFGR